MFHIEYFTQDSISFLENIKDDDMQGKERVSKNMSFSISSGESRWRLLHFSIFYKKNIENHANVLHFYIGFYRLFFIVPSDFQYHNEKTSSAIENLFYIENLLKKVAVVGCNLCFICFFHFGTENRGEELKKHPVCWIFEV